MLIYRLKNFSLNFFFVYIKCIQYQLKDIKMQQLAFLIIRNSNEIWVSMKDVHNVSGVKNMSDLDLKEIYRRYEKQTLQMNKLRNTQQLKEFLKV